MNRQESKVKINKIIPYDKVPKSKTEPLVINGENYAMAPTRLEENYTGFTIYLHLIVILPDAHDYEYLKVDVSDEVWEGQGWKLAVRQAYQQKAGSVQRHKKEQLT